MSGLLDSPDSLLPRWAPNSGIVTPGSASTSTSGQNTLRLMPVCVPNAVRITGLTMEVTAAGDPGAVCRLGIWASDPSMAYPQRLLTATTGTTIPADAIGFGTVALSLVVPPGVIWLGGMTESSAAAPTYRVSTILSEAFSTTTVNVTGGAAMVLTGQTPGSFGNLANPPFASSGTAFKFNLTIGAL